jgi:hypothetical protein
MRFDPFRELDRLAEQTMSAGARAHAQHADGGTATRRRGEHAASGGPEFRRPLLRCPNVVAEPALAEPTRG